MLVRIYIAADEIGSLVLDDDQRVIKPRALKSEYDDLIQGLLEPYKCLVDGKVVEFTTENPEAFLFYLRDFYYSSQGVSAGPVEE
jgi:hypothetical protein